MTRRPRQRRPRGRSRVGERFTAEVGAVAHGGHCVARVATEADDPSATRVVFVRHALPGERVVLEVTEGTDGDRFWRADAVEVLDPSPDRVTPPCPVAGPGLCGGCDFQHASLARQRELKAEVVREQLVRLARLPADHPLLSHLVVEEVPGDQGGLRWRTRVQFARTPDGGRGMRVHRSRRVVAVDDCRITRSDARVLTDRHPGAAAAPVLERVVLDQVEDGAATGGAVHDFSVEADGFWQVHPGAPTVLVGTVLSFLVPRPGETVLDLYAGVGLFARFLGDAVGAGTRIVAVEGNRGAARHAVSNLSGLERATVECGSVDRVLASAYDEPFDLVVLDPPREGARRPVVEQVVDRAPRAVAYVACDPAALARDVAIFAEHGYRLERLRALDLFPMTHHVECVALLVR